MADPLQLTNGETLALDTNDNWQGDIQTVDAGGVIRQTADDTVIVIDGVIVLNGGTAGHLGCDSTKVTTGLISGSGTDYWTGATPGEETSPLAVFIPTVMVDQTVNKFTALKKT